MEILKVSNLSKVYGKKVISNALNIFTFFAILLIFIIIYKEFYVIILIMFFLF